MNAHVVPAQLAAMEAHKMRRARMMAPAIAMVQDRLRAMREQAERDAELKRESEWRIEVHRAWKNSAAKLLLAELKRRGDYNKLGDFLLSANSKRRISDIVGAVCLVSGISRIDLLSHRRDAIIVLARQFAMYRAKCETTKSYPEIGRLFGGRDHTTVMHAFRKTQERMAKGLIPLELLATIPGEPT